MKLQRNGYLDLKANAREFSFYLSKEEILIYKAFPPGCELIFFPSKPFTTYKRISLLLSKIKRNKARKRR